MDSNEFAFRLDPSVALKPLSVAPYKAKAFYSKLEFVIEIVGPRTMSSSLAMAALRPDWQNALANPKVVGMAPADSDWQVITSQSVAQVFDSLAFCWPFMKPNGNLSNASAQHLLSVSESFSNQVQRRAIPHLPADDVDARVSDLQAISNELDFGVGITLSSPLGTIPEISIWEVAANLGLDLDSCGDFVWRQDGFETPLLTLSSLGQTDVFSLQGAKSNQLHPAISIGFRIAVNPTPEETAERMADIARTFASRLSLDICDEDGKILTQDGLSGIIDSVKQASETIKRAGIAPGSPESLLIFV